MGSIQRGDQIDEVTLIDLIQRAQERNDPDAFDGLYLLYADKIFRFLMTRLEDSDDAEEITAQVFLRLIENIDKYRVAPKDNVAIFSAWLYRMAHNKMIDNLRKHKRTRAVPIEKMERMAEQRQIMVQVEEQLDFELLLQRLKMLNEQQQQVIILRFIEGFSIAETAQIMRKTEGAVKALQHRSVQNLRRYLRTD
jgi:RNA polymerase sigma-70 factor (ECF subfamily)